MPYGMLPSVIMFLVVVVCIIGYGLANANLEDSRAQFIERRFHEHALRVDAAFDSYAHLLLGSTARVETGSFDETTWNRFVSIFDIRNNFAGMEALGLTARDSAGNMVITHFSPETSLTTKAIGMDIGQIEGLKPTMEESARSGKITISDPLPNIFSTKQDIATVRAGFIMMAPYYDKMLPQLTPEQREQALLGYTMAMFRGEVFFDEVFKQTDTMHMKLSVYLGEDRERNLLYEAGETTTNNLHTVNQKITKYGKTFTLVYVFDNDYILGFSQNYLPQFLVLGGLIIGMLIASVAGYMLRYRYQRLTAEKEQAVAFAKDELLSLASHQLRTPATGVKQYLGMVLQGFAGEISEQQRAYLERAYTINNRQLQVVNDILHLAKLESGRIVLAEHEFNIAQMVHDIVDEHRTGAEESGIALHLKAPTSGLMVGDSHMLRMVVENLVSNAIKYTPAGGVVIVRLARRGDKWVVTVKDTGVGIAESDFPKLFQQFSRINNPRSYSVTGTGVGLYLAHHLTELHGGSISVSSVESKGSTFTVKLPRKM